MQADLNVANANHRQADETVHQLELQVQDLDAQVLQLTSDLSAERACREQEQQQYADTTSQQMSTWQQTEQDLQAKLTCTESQVELLTSDLADTQRAKSDLCDQLAAVNAQYAECEVSCHEIRSELTNTQVNLQVKQTELQVSRLVLATRSLLIRNQNPCFPCVGFSAPGPDDLSDVRR
jgi:chromosome segregation ATPase